MMGDPSLGGVVFFFNHPEKWGRISILTSIFFSDGLGLVKNHQEIAPISNNSINFWNSQKKFTDMSNTCIFFAIPHANHQVAALVNHQPQP